LIFKKTVLISERTPTSEHVEPTGSDVTRRIYVVHHFDQSYRLPGTTPFPDRLRHLLPGCRCSVFSFQFWCSCKV